MGRQLALRSWTCVPQPVGVHELCDSGAQRSVHVDRWFQGGSGCLAWGDSTQGRVQSEKWARPGASAFRECRGGGDAQRGSKRLGRGPLM